jgi:SAM-dependent methyltransferase
LSIPKELQQTRKQILKRLRLLGVAFKFRLHETIKARMLGYRERQVFRVPAADGLPLPPPKLMVLVGGDTNAPAFFSGGEITAQVIRDMLGSDGADIGQMKAILDFGCGCGRVMRHWRSISGRVALHGTDYNKVLIGWCRRNLPFAQFGINRLKPPLDYKDDSFDLVYAFSIFTHLPEDLQESWMNELVRVLAPGGYLFITVHGENFRHALTSDEQIVFDGNGVVVRHAQMAGSNRCTAFHPVDYVHNVLARNLRVVEHAPAKLGQDAVLLRKPL